MIIRFYSICVFVVLINKVYLQVTVKAVVGGSVVLPCSTTEHDLKPQDTDVHWRHNGSKIVYDIIKGEDSLEKQDPRYKNRAETFPDKYLGGNFSLELSNLEHTDAGKYSCLISHSSEHSSVKLIVFEPTTENGTKSDDQRNQKEEQDVATSSSLLGVYIGVPALLIMLILTACLISLFIYKKKIKTALFSPVGTDDKAQRKK